MARDFKAILGWDVVGDLCFDVNVYHCTSVCRPFDGWYFSPRSHCSISSMVIHPRYTSRPRAIQGLHWAAIHQSTPSDPGVTLDSYIPVDPERSRGYTGQLYTSRPRAIQGLHWPAIHQSTPSDPGVTLDSYIPVDPERSRGYTGQLYTSRPRAIQGLHWPAIHQSTPSDPGVTLGSYAPSVFSTMKQMVRAGLCWGRTTIISIIVLLMYVTQLISSLHGTSK